MAQAVKTLRWVANAGDLTLNPSGVEAFAEVGAPLYAPTLPPVGVEASGEVGSASASGSSGLLFNITWPTTGTSDAAIYSQGDAVPFINDGINTPNGVCAIVSGSSLVTGLGTALPAPPSGGNAAKVTHLGTTTRSGHFGISPNLWSNPQIGETRFFSFEFMAACEDDEPSTTNQFPSGHGLEVGQQGTAASTEDWEFESGSHGTADGSPGKYPWVFGNLTQTSGSRWRPGEPSTFNYNILSKWRWYTKQFAWTKTATNTYTLNDIRIYSAAGVLLYDRNSFYNNNGNQLLATNGTGKTMTDGRVGQFHIGTNGGGNWIGLIRDEYDYWGRIQVRSDTWPTVFGGAG